MNSLECFSTNTLNNLNPPGLITNLLNFAINGLKEDQFDGGREDTRVLRSFIRILDQTNLEEEEVSVVAKGAGEIVSLLYQRRKSRMRCFGMYLEMVECFLKRENHLGKMSIDILASYGNLLAFIVNNCKIFLVDAQISVIKGIGVLGGAKIPQIPGDHGRVGRCLQCGKNCVGLLNVLVRNVVRNPCIVNEVLHSAVKISENECCKVEMFFARLDLYLFEDLCRPFIKNGTCFSENHFVQNLVKLLDAFPRFKKRVFLFAKEALMKCINGKNNKRMILSDLHPEILNCFNGTLFPEHNFDEEMNMLLSLSNHCLNGVVHESRVFRGLWSNDLVDIIAHPRLSYKFHQNSSEFTCLLKNACRYFNKKLSDYESFVGKYFSRFQALSKKIEELSVLDDDKSRVSIVITLMRMIDFLFTDGCDFRKKAKGCMGLRGAFHWKTLKAIVKVRDLILSLYSQDLMTPRNTLPQCIRIS
jgi:hypothetical protein